MSLEKIVDTYKKEDVNNLGILNLNAKETVEWLNKCDVKEVLDIGNTFFEIMECYENIYDLNNDDINEILCIDNFSQIFWDTGLGFLTGFNYYAPNEVYYVNRWIKSEKEAKQLMLSNIERELDDNNLDILKGEIIRYWLDDYYFNINRYDD